MTIAFGTTIKSSTYIKIALIFKGYFYFGLLFKYNLLHFSILYQITAIFLVDIFQIALPFIHRCQQVNPINCVIPTVHVISITVTKDNHPHVSINPGLSHISLGLVSQIMKSETVPCPLLSLSKPHENFKAAFGTWRMYRFYVSSYSKTCLVCKG